MVNIHYSDFPKDPDEEKKIIDQLSEDKYRITYREKYNAITFLGKNVFLPAEINIHSLSDVFGRFMTLLNSGNAASVTLSEFPDQFFNMPGMLNHPDIAGHIYNMIEDLTIDAQNRIYGLSDRRFETFLKACEAKIINHKNESSGTGLLIRPATTESKYRHVIIADQCKEKAGLQRMMVAKDYKSLPTHGMHKAYLSLHTSSKTYRPPRKAEIQKAIIELTGLPLAIEQANKMLLAAQE
jgi:hypothetical protein